MSPWTFQEGLNVTVDETWVDVTSRHLRGLGLYPLFKCTFFPSFGIKFVVSNEITRCLVRDVYMYKKGTFHLLNVAVSS